MITNPAVLRSPRIDRLERRLAAGDTSALEAFWSEVEAEGTPLVEQASDSPGHLLVTFVWRDRGNQEVALIQDWGADGLVDHPMTLLPGTDLWHYTRLLPADTRSTYQLAPDGRYRLDPLNPRKALASRADPERPGDQDIRFSAYELPEAPRQPYVEPRLGVPSGLLDLHRLPRGLDDRPLRVWAYTPPGYSPEREHSLLLLFDGRVYTDPEMVPTPTILDNLLVEGRIPALVAVFVDHLDRQRELHANPAYVGFVADVLLPWVERRYRVTSAPERRVVAGASSGGLGAAYLGLVRPDLFGNVLSQTGWFVWSPDGDPEPEWLAREYARHERRPLRFYLDVGRLETARLLGNRPSQLTANRHFRTVLQAKGYPVHYSEHSGGHDFECLRATLADGLIALLPA